MSLKPKLLLHACCATCCIYIPKLLSADYDVTIFYYNPNVHPSKEYKKRRDGAAKAAHILNLGFIEHKYDMRQWFRKMRGKEDQAEGGERCEDCFEFRLKETAKYAKKHGYQKFGTVLTVGRNKKANIINPIGEKVAKEIGVPFLVGDFKKNGGLDISVERTELYGLYRQSYCGCTFSYRDSLTRIKGQEIKEEEESVGCL